MSATDLSQFRQRVVGRAISETSWDQYSRWIQRFEAWLNSSGIDSPNIGDIEAFDGLLADESRTGYPWENGQGRPAPPSYAYRSRMTAISAVKLWVRREYDIRLPEAPDDICIGEPEPFDPTYLPPERVEAVYDEADDACDLDGCEAALRLSYDAILRASELARIERDDVDLNEGTVYVKASKGSKNMEVGVSEETVEALTEHIEEHPDRNRLFYNSYDRPWTAKAWGVHVLRNHCEAGSHAFGRHSPILHRLEGGQPFGEVYRRARHHSASMTAQYAREVGVDVPEWAAGQD